MSRIKPLSFKSREEWRKWLKKNHRSAHEIWLNHSKKQSNMITITLGEAVEEAICFGWIDSRIRSIDSEKYAVRYTPRQAKRKWSKYNSARALKMLKEGRMTPAGIKALPKEILESWNRTKRAPSIIDPRTRTIA